jgi:hypothetical protein
MVVSRCMLSARTCCVGKAHTSRAQPGLATGRAALRAPRRQAPRQAGPSSAASSAQSQPGHTPGPCALRPPAPAAPSPAPAAPREAPEQQSRRRAWKHTSHLLDTAARTHARQALPLHPATASDSQRQRGVGGWVGLGGAAAAHVGLVLRHHRGGQPHVQAAVLRAVAVVQHHVGAAHQLQAARAAKEGTELDASGCLLSAAGLGCAAPPWPPSLS